MNQTVMLVLVLRVIAVWVFINIFKDIDQGLLAISFWDRSVSSSALWSNLIIGVLVPLLLKLIVVILFWFFPNKFVSKISGLPEEEKAPINLDVVPLIILLGMYFVSTAFIDFSTLVPNIVYLYETEGLKRWDSLRIGVIYNSITCAVQLVIGLYFIFGSKGIRNMVYKLRSTKVR